MRQVTITVYDYTELPLGSIDKAYNEIFKLMSDTERAFMDDAFKDFTDIIRLSECYYWNDLPERIDYQWDFKDSYNFSGKKQGGEIIEAFKQYLSERWEYLSFSIENIKDYCEDNSIYFFEDGSLYTEV